MTCFAPIPLQAFDCTECEPMPDARGIYRARSPFAPPLRWSECDPQPREVYT